MRTIAHLDLDAFFASVEMRLRPALARKPVVVAGLGARSVVAAASYPARAFGVRSGMPLFQARSLCPGLVVVSPRFAAYREVSRRVFALASSMADVLEVLGIDEAFAAVPAPDASQFSLNAPTGPASEAAAGGFATVAGEWAARVRSQVFSELGLPLSIGVSDSKVAAKLCSRRAKPDGVFIVDPLSSGEFLRGLPVGEVPGVGPRTLALLTDLGVVSVGDVLDVSPESLASRAGWAATQWLLSVARNEDARPVVPAVRQGQVGVSRTFDEDLVGDALSGRFEELLFEVLRRLSADGRAAQSVSVRFVPSAASSPFARRARTDRSSVSGGSLRESLPVSSLSMRLSSPTRDLAALAAAARQLFARVPSGPVRQVGVSFSGLSEAEQLMFEGLTLPEPSDGSSDARSDGSSGSAPRLVLPPVAPPSFLGAAYHGAVIEHDVFGVGVLLSVLEGEPLAVLEGVLPCRVLFDRERIVSSSHLRHRRSPIEA